ncbi:hypothetical protein [Methanosarcina siciliae]|uniref:hypothetical protein n=1 Tax=Methanosarcina siciliae TaxID=38027 RepID=UPI000A6FC20A|nr:hypothetical protein [Methanosarcina siciliae]
MSFQNLKVATKDIDIVLRSTRKLELTRNALLSMGYFVTSFVLAASGSSSL